MTPAEVNRRRVAEKRNIEGYLEQERMRERWQFGELPPEGLRLGWLPQIHQRIASQMGR